MEMIASRNQTTHTYDEETAGRISEGILKKYVDLFNSFSKKLEELRADEQ